MKFAAALVALAALAAAAPNKVEERDVSPSSVTAALLQVLPSSIIAVAITNQAAASSLIVAAFQTGTPAWFASLPADVQTYLVTADASLVNTAAATATGAAGGSVSVVSPPLTTGSSGNGTASSTGKYSNSTVTSTGTSTKTTSSSSSSKASAASSSSSSGGAAIPTAIIGSGIAGAIGILGMLAL